MHRALGAGEAVMLSGVATRPVTGADLRNAKASSAFEQTACAESVMPIATMTAFSRTVARRAGLREGGATARACEQLGRVNVDTRCACFHCASLSVHNRCVDGDLVENRLLRKQRPHVLV